MQHCLANHLISFKAPRFAELFLLRSGFVRRDGSGGRVVGQDPVELGFFRMPEQIQHNAYSALTVDANWG